MKATTAIRIIESQGRDLSTMTVEELKQALMDCFRVTASGLREAASYIRELDSRREDLTGLKLPLFDHLRRIANGHALPEIVVRFAATPMLCGLICNLPTPDQEAIARGEPVRLFEFAPDGSLTYRLLDPLFLSRGQVHQVFAKDHIRCKDEQACILYEKREKDLHKNN